MIIIIPYQNTNLYRERNLRYTLDYYLGNPQISKIVLVEQETETDIKPHPKLKHVKIKIDDKYFCRAELINKGVSYSDSDIIGIVDNDCLINKNINIDQMDNYDVFYPFSDINFLSEGHTRQLIRDGKYIQEKIKTKLHVNRYNGGAVFIKTNCFYDVKKYNKEIKGWGREDDVFIEKCKRLNYKIGRTEKDAHMDHLFHPTESTEKYKKSERFKLNSEILALFKRMSKEDFSSYICNETNLLNHYLDKYRKMGKLYLDVNVRCGSGALYVDSTIYDITPDENGNFGLRELLEVTYQEDGKRTLAYVMDVIKNTCGTLSLEENQLILEFKRNLN